MKNEIKLAGIKVTEAHIAVSGCFDAQSAVLKNFPEALPFTNVRAGLCEIQDRMHDMFVELEAKSKRLDKD